MLIGCNNHSMIETAQVGNYKVEKLFTIDGITVYRFYAERVYYFASKENVAKVLAPGIVITVD